MAQGTWEKSKLKALISGKIQRYFSCIWFCMITWQICSAWLPHGTVARSIIARLSRMPWSRRRDSEASWGIATGGTNGTLKIITISTISFIFFLLILIVSFIIYHYYSTCTIYKIYLYTHALSRITNLAFVFLQVPGKSDSLLLR